MSSRSKREYLEAIYPRYKAAYRGQKKIILDEFCAACRYHRKHAIRLLKQFRRFIKPKHKKKGYTPRGKGLIRMEEFIPSQSLLQIMLATSQQLRLRL